MADRLRELLACGLFFPEARDLAVLMLRIAERAKAEEANVRE